MTNVICQNVYIRMSQQKKTLTLIHLQIVGVLDRYRVEHYTNGGGN